KILKQQLVDITQQETRKEKKTRKRLPLDDSFARKRKVMKKNLKPKGPKINVQDSISQVKEEVQNAKERKEKNKEWNMKIIDAVSQVNGEDVMNRYLVKKGLREEEKKEKKEKVTSSSYRIRETITKDSKPSAFV
ncbi:hypothetical protein WA538_001857, partial [Blastocystis sp. DL]